MNDCEGKETNGIGWIEDEEKMNDCEGKEMNGIGWIEDEAKMNNWQGKERNRIGWIECETHTWINVKENNGNPVNGELVKNETKKK